MGTIASLLVKINGDISGLQGALTGASDSVRQAGERMQSAGIKMTAGVTAPIAGIAVVALNSAANFEQSMNVMQQVSGATEGQMASLQAQALELGAQTSFSAGEAAAAMLELSKAGLSASEVSAAIGGTLDLAAAGGLDLAQAATITANAVNAFGLEASSANDVANLLAAAANASSVEVTDLALGMQMASAVFSSSGQSIETLNTALALMGNNGLKGSDAGTSLKTMLMSLTAPSDAAAGQLANLGVSVYDAAGNMRALPDVMADLQSALYGTNAVTVTSSNLTGEQAERMAYLKSTIESTQKKLADYQSGVAGVAQSENDKVVAVDRLNRVLVAAQAEYSGLASVGGTTSTVMRTLTEEQRNAALTTIFGTDAIRAANILLKEGEGGWTSMADALGNETAAADIANARMRGMAGAIEYFKGSVDSFLISTALPFLDSISGIVRYAADAVTAIGNLPAPVKNAAIAFALAAAAIGPLLIGLGMAAGAISAALPVLGAIAGAFAALASPVGLVVIAVAALGAAWAANVGGIRDATMPVVNAVTTALQRAQVAVLAFGASQTWSRVTATVAGAFGNIGAALAGAFSGDVSLPDLAGKISAELGKVAQAVGGALASADFAAMKDGIVKALGIGEIDVSSITASLAGVRDKVVSAVTSIDWAGGFNTAVGAVNGVRDAVLGWLSGAIGGVNWPSLSLDFAGMIDAVTNKLKSIDWSTVNPVSLFLPLVGRLIPGVGQAVGTANWVISSDKFAGLVASVQTALSTIDWGAIGTALAGLAEGVKNAIVGLDWSALAGAAEPVRAAVQGLFDGLQLNIKLPTIDTSGISATMAEVTTALAPSFERLQASLGTIPGSLAQLQPSVAGLVGAFGSLWNALQPVLRALGTELVVYASIGASVLATVIQNLPGLIKPSIDQVTAIINVIATTISGVTATITAIATGDWAAAWESLKGIVTGFETFVQSTWTNVTTMLGNVGTTIGQAATNVLNDLGLTAAAETVQSIIGAIGQLKTDIESLSVSDILQPLLEWQWPTFTSIPDVINTLVGWAWPSFPDLPTFLTTLVGWAWPSFPSMPGWLDRLLSWQWPSPPDVGGAAADAAGTVNDAVGAMGGAINDFTGGIFGGNNQLGTAYAHGGWSWVGENRRPELLYLPRGSQVVPWQEAKEMQGGAGGVNVTIQSATVRNDQDLWKLGNAIDRAIRRRR